jgi:chromosomal replication initiator protein
MKGLTYYSAPGIKAVIPPQIMTEEMQEATAKAIINTVSKYYNIPYEVLIGSIRQLEAVKCRHIAMWLITQKVKGMPLIKIGKMFGGRDHTTVINARERINGFYHVCKYPDYTNDIDTLLQII